MAFYDADPAELNELDVDELGLIILDHLRTIPDNEVSWNNFQSSLANRFGEVMVRGPLADELRSKVAAGWQWLRNEGLISPHPYNAGNWEAVTPAGRGATEAYLAESRSLQLLRRAILDPVLLERTMRIFRRGLYAAAVFQAMLEVEVRVKRLTNLPKYGVDLMTEAFNPQGGPLVDRSTSLGDQRSRMDLYRGAVGTFKNQNGHNVPGITDPQEAVEAILLANALLRMLPPLPS